MTNFINMPERKMTVKYLQYESLFQVLTLSYRSRQGRWRCPQTQQLSPSLKHPTIYQCLHFSQSFIEHLPLFTMLSVQTEKQKNRKLKYSNLPWSSTCFPQKAHIKYCINKENL